MNCESGKRPGTRWRQVLVLAGAAMLLQGCGYLVFNVGDLKDNPMDQAIETGDEFAHMKETRDRLLKRYPIGQPVASVRRYLQSIGAKCVNGKVTDTKVTCHYSKHVDVVLRTPLGDFREIRSFYDFRIELTNQRGSLRGVIVCRRISRMHYHGRPADKKKSVTVPMECPEADNTKGISLKS